MNKINYRKIFNLSLGLVLIGFYIPVAFSHGGVQPVYDAANTKQSAETNILISQYSYPALLNANKGINKSTKAINNLVGGYGVDQLTKTPTALFAPSPDRNQSRVSGALVAEIAKLFGTNNIGPSGVGPAYKAQKHKPVTLTGAAINTLLTTVDPYAELLKSIRIPAPLPSKQVGVNYNYQGTQVKQQTPPTQSFSFNSLIMPIQYSKAEQANAKHFIRFAMGLAQPAGVIDITKLKPKQIKEALVSNKSFQQYLIALRDYTADKSIAIGNFYYLYAQRVPIPLKQLEKAVPGLKKIPKLAKDNKNGISALKLDEFMATRRFTNPKWQENIEKKATPAELQRQSVLLLREISRSLYKNRLTNERILATLSALQMQSAAGQQLAINNFARSICQTEPFKGSALCGSNGGAFSTTTPTTS